MVTLNKQVFPRKLPQGDVRFTVNLRAANLRRLIDATAGGRLVAGDQDVLPGVKASENVQRVWAALEEAPPKEFVSMAVRSGADSSGVAATLASYGTIVLEISPAVVAMEGVIFNGDVKNLSVKVAADDDPGWVHRIAFDGDVSLLADELRRLTTSGRSTTPTRPRLVGSYFEARLRRALVPQDIVAVWADPSDEEALRVASDLCGSKA
ncbi:hypothetical protein WME94_53140 [Sorangium sp. So ce429]